MTNPTKDLLTLEIEAAEAEQQERDALLTEAGEAEQQERDALLTEAAEAEQQERGANDSTT